jgi:hypothetical protein
MSHAFLFLPFWDVRVQFYLMKRLLSFLLTLCYFGVYGQDIKVDKLESPGCLYEVYVKDSAKFIGSILEIRHLLYFDFQKKKISVYSTKKDEDLDILSFTNKEMDNYRNLVFKFGWFFVGIVD